MTTTPVPTLNLEITLFGETRTVEAVRGTTTAWVAGLVARIGNGRANYPATLTLWEVTDERPAREGQRTVTADDGSVWKFHLGTCIRNRQARIIGWADVAGVTNAHDQTRAAR